MHTRCLSWTFVCLLAAGVAARAEAGALVGPTPLRDGTLAVPAVGEPPDWATPEVFARAIEAREDGLAWDFVAARAVVPVASPSQLLIRPGVQIFPESIFPGWCTAAFLFDGGTRISTAGHCTRRGDLVLAVTAPSTVFVMGTTSASTAGGSTIGSDWATITIDPLWRPFADAATAWVGGPCGAIARPPVPVLKYVGHGAAVGTGGTARAGVFDSFGLSNLFDDPAPGFTAWGPAYFGDSGGPVLETTQTNPAAGCAAGAAVGILTHVQVAFELAPTGFFFGTPVSKVSGQLTSAGLLQ